MTTATTEAPEKVWTLKEVQRQERTLTDLRERLEALAAEEEELDGRIAEAIADGDDPAELQDKRGELRDERTDLAAAEPLLAEKVRERRYLARRELARQRMEAIAKRVDGIVKEAHRRAEKAAELTDALEAELRYLADVGLHRRLLAAEAGALSRGYGLDAPDLERLDVDGPRILAETRRQLHRVELPRDTLTVQKTDLELVGALVRMFDEETPTRDLLAALEDGSDAT